MKKTFNKLGEHNGYEIGKDISIHSHITDPESWFLTIRPLEVYGRSICRKSATEEDILKVVKSVISTKIRIAESILIMANDGTVN